MKKDYFHDLLSAITSLTNGSIHKIIHVIGVVAIENINIYFPPAIINTITKADFPGDHPITGQRMSTRQPASSSGTTVIRINRIIDDLCAVNAVTVVLDAVPPGSLPVWCARFLLITTIATTAKVVFYDPVVSCEGVQDIIVGTMLIQGRALS